MEKEKEKVPASILTLVAGIVITVVSFWYGQNNHLLPEQASEQAPLVDGLFNVMVTIATALFIVVEGAIVFFAVKYRYRPGDEGDGVPVSENFPLEIFWTAVPAILVIGLGIYSVEVFRDMGGFDPGSPEVMAHVHSSSKMAHMPKGSAIAAPLIADSEEAAPEMAEAPNKAKYGFGATPTEGAKAPDLEVNVLGLQYAWIFTYPASGVSSGELHVPVGKDVQLNLSAQDVIHSFWMPQFRLKQDAIPGIPTELRFVATKPGDYPVFCAELCGGYHGSMRTRVIVHTQEDYDSWLQENMVAQQQGLNEAVAINPAELPASEFLAPYADRMGVNAETVAQLQPSH
ncbi:MAG: cytochrome c oxidase subunit II [Richelia sp. CSU_2_1]|nr:cytochrome c oxidase subunit II [Richelia sp. CSU_2_1]